MAGGRVPSRDPTVPKSRLDRGAERLAKTRAVSWYLIRIGTIVDPLLMRLSRGRLNSTGTDNLVVLSHVGNKTGTPRKTPLVYFTDGEDVILIASKGGAAENPAWLHNVRATPDVELHVGPWGGRYRAREAAGAERDRLWALATTLYTGYDAYQQRTDRQIPVVVCTPQS